MERTQAPQIGQRRTCVERRRQTPKRSRERASRPSGEDGAGEVRAQLLHGAPEHTVAAAAVIRVRVEEPRCGRGLTAEAEDARR
jgi:hypothetical protein